LRSLPIERLKLNYTSGLISLCTTEIDAALYYRTLSKYSNEPVLKQILKLMFADEVKHYRVFLKYFYLQDQKEKSSSLKIFKTIVNRHELVAQQNIAVSLKHARDGWHSDSYFKNNFNDQEILHKMKLTIAKRFPYELAAKMLAKPLKNDFFVLQFDTCFNKIQFKISHESIIDSTSI
jgi:rubrerythrin